MPERAPSDNLFRDRLDALVERDGRAAVARFYDRSPQTIARWQTGAQRPSERTRISVNVRGRRAVGPEGQAIQIRDARGRFRTIVTNPTSAAAVRRENRRRRDERRRAIASARTERSRAAAEMIPEEMSEGEIMDLDTLIERMLEAEDWEWEEYGNEWRTLYDQLSG